MYSALFLFALPEVWAQLSLTTANKCDSEGADPHDSAPNPLAMFWVVNELQHLYLNQGVQRQAQSC
jgi:hypothetical protein